MNNKVPLPAELADKLRALGPLEAVQFKGDNGDNFIFMKTEEYERLVARVPRYVDEGAT